MVSLPRQFLTLLVRARPLALRIMMFTMMMSLMRLKNRQRMRMTPGFVFGHPLCAGSASVTTDDPVLVACVKEIDR